MRIDLLQNVAPALPERESSKLDGDFPPDGYSFSMVMGQMVTNKNVQHRQELAPDTEEINGDSAGKYGRGKKQTISLDSKSSDPQPAPPTGQGSPAALDENERFSNKTAKAKAARTSGPANEASDLGPSVLKKRSASPADAKAGDEEVAVSQGSAQGAAADNSRKIAASADLAAATSEGGAKSASDSGASMPDATLASGLPINTPQNEPVKVPAARIAPEPADDVKGDPKTALAEPEVIPLKTDILPVSLNLFPQVIESQTGFIPSWQISAEAAKQVSRTAASGKASGDARTANQDPNGTPVSSRVIDSSSGAPTKPGVLVPQITPEASSTSSKATTVQGRPATESQTAVRNGETPIPEGKGPVVTTGTTPMAESNLQTAGQQRVLQPAVAAIQDRDLQQPQTVINYGMALAPEGNGPIEATETTPIVQSDLQTAGQQGVAQPAVGVVAPQATGQMGAPYAAIQDSDLPLAVDVSASQAAGQKGSFRSTIRNSESLSAVQEDTSKLQTGTAEENSSSLVNRQVTDAARLIRSMGSLVVPISAQVANPTDHPDGARQSLSPIPMTASTAAGTERTVSAEASSGQAAVSEMPAIGATASALSLNHESADIPWQQAFNPDAATAASAITLKRAGETSPGKETDKDAQVYRRRGAVMESAPVYLRAPQHVTESRRLAQPVAENSPAEQQKAGFQDENTSGSSSEAQSGSAESKKQKLSDMPAPKIDTAESAWVDMQNAQRALLDSLPTRGSSFSLPTSNALRPIQLGNSATGSNWNPVTPTPQQAAATEFKALSVLLAPKSAGPSQQSDFLSQLAERIQTQIRDGQDIIRIQLKPSSLGRLEIRAETTNTGVMATIMTESTGVKNYLENNLHQLQQSFQDQGLRIDRIQVTVQEGFVPQQPSSGFQESHPGSRQPGEATTSDPSAEAVDRAGDELNVDLPVLSVISPNSTFHTVA